MIVIKTKSDVSVIDERNVVDVNFNKKRKEAWIRVIKPDCKIESFNYRGVSSVEYRPNTESFTLTMNDDDIQV